MALPEHGLPLGLRVATLRSTTPSASMPAEKQDDFYRTPNPHEQIADHVAAIQFVQHFVPGEALMSHPGWISVCVNATSTIKYTHVGPGNQSSHSRVGRRRFSRG